MGDRCGVSRNKYKYIGKELDTMYGWNMQDHEARWYDSVMGRWMATDPLQEKKVLENVKEKLGLDKTETLPKQKGKFGSPSRGNSKTVIVLPPHIQMQNQVAEKNIHILTIGISQKANEMPEALVVQNL